MDWNTFVTTLTATGIASTAFVFLAKILSKHLLSMDLERFKAELRATNEKELERLRTDLRITAFQQETTFAKLHEKRAEVIAELYAKLAAVDVAMRHLVAVLPIVDVPNDEATEKEARRAGQDFSEYLNRHLIYFDKPLSDLLTAYDLEMVRVFESHLKMPDVETDRLHGWLTIQAILERQSKRIREEIERSFRQLLGLTVQKLEREGTLPEEK